MKNVLHPILGAAFAVALAAGAARAADSEPGLVDWGTLSPSAHGKFVEVNLSPGLLKLAARLTARDEPDTADLLAGLKRVRINVVGLDDSNRAGTVEQIESIRHKLESAGWAKMVTVREAEHGDNVAIYVKQHGEDALDGVVVTVIGHQGEAVFVNIVGHLNFDQLAKVADELDIEPLRHLQLKAAPKAGGHPV